MFHQKKNLKFNWTVHVRIIIALGPALPLCKMLVAPPGSDHLPKSSQIVHFTHFAVVRRYWNKMLISQTICTYWFVSNTSVNWFSGYRLLEFLSSRWQLIKRIPQTWFTRLERNVVLRSSRLYAFSAAMPLGLARLSAHFKTMTS